MNESPNSSCPKCGTAIAADAPHGLCPKCVFNAVVTETAPSPHSSGKTPAPTVEEVATHFPELDVLGLIGAGGMGAVYKARQPKLDRTVALKILSADLAKDPAFAERFNREGRILARLNHPHIVSVFDFGKQGPFLYLLLEYVDGVNLREAMQAGEFTAGDSLALVQDICAALKFAHDEGILHRDIKPENVLLDSRGRVKIADFGLAKLVGKDASEDITLTQQGAVMGTLHYMAPEQLETPLDVDQRADIYSLGVVFYELLTGELPLGRFALPSGKSSLDPRIDDVVLRALERKREQRYQNVGEVKTDVEAISQSKAGGSAYPSATLNASSNAATTQITETPPRMSRSAKQTTSFACVTLLLSIATVFALVAVNSFFPRQDVLLVLVPGVGVLMMAVSAIVTLFFGIRTLGGMRKLTVAAARNIANIPGQAPTTARFANASAFVTIISLLLGAFVMFVLITSNALVATQEDYKSFLLWAIAATGTLIVLATALLGFFFGIIAMGEIHRSGGRKLGFGTALFGTLGWLALVPIVGLGIIIFFLVS